MKLKTLSKILILSGLLSLPLSHAGLAEEGRLPPSDPGDLKILADQQLRSGDTLSAIENYEKTVSLDPSFHAVYFNLAVAYYTDGQITEAAKNLELLIQLSPGDTEAIYNLGCLKLYLGDTQNAEKYFQCAVSSCSSTSRFKPLLEDGISFLKQVKQLAPEKQRVLFLLFRQGTIPTLTA